MADLNQYLKAALEKQKLKEQKIETKSPLKVAKGIRPYNFVNEEHLDKKIDLNLITKDEIKENLNQQNTTEVQPIKRNEVVEELNNTVKSENIKLEKIDTKNEINNTITSENNDLSLKNIFKNNIIDKSKSIKVENDQNTKYLAEEYEDGYQNAHRTLGKGFTRIPNEIIVKLLSGDFEQREARVLLTILRLSSGFGKTWVSVSAKYVSDITKIPINYVFATFKSLIAKGVIEKKTNSEHERKLANQYRVLFDTKNSFLDYVVEETGFSLKIEEYLESIIVKTQKEIEKKSVRELIESGLNQEEIFEAIKILKDRGMPGSGEKPNNPAAFLVKAGSRVFDEIRKKNIKKQSAIVQNNQLQEADKAEEEKFNQIESEFLSKFSSEKLAEDKVTELIEIYNLNGSGKLKLPYFVARKLAIQKWFESQTINI